MAIICGIDEAGRGPLAGPVTAAAVILPDHFPVTGLADSKQLSEKKRTLLASLIMTHCPFWAVGWVWPDEIDRLNIHNASLLAMERAYARMGTNADQVLIDGLYVPPNLDAIGTAIVKGDTKIPAIQAASILAKTSRDRWMIRYSWIEPDYGFEKHKGYPTAAHRACCHRMGLSPIHRKSFRISPVS